MGLGESIRLAFEGLRANKMRAVLTMLGIIIGIAAVIGMDDHVVEFEITPNRPDCLSVIGLAREASATFKRPLKLHTPEPHGCGGSIADLVDIDIEDGDLCPPVGGGEGREETC